MRWNLIFTKFCCCKEREGDRKRGREIEREAKHQALSMLDDEDEKTREN